MLVGEQDGGPRELVGLSPLEPRLPVTVSPWGRAAHFTVPAGQTTHLSTHREPQSLNQEALDFSHSIFKNIA